MTRSFFILGLRYIGRFIPPFLNVWWYRFLGMKIERGTRFGFGVCILADNVEIAHNVFFEDGVHIEQLNKFEVRPFVCISRNTLVNGDSDLFIGENSFIGSQSIINVREKVIIAENVALAGAGVQIWTHSTWLEKWEGFDKQEILAPVMVQKDVLVGTGAIILPGVDIAEGVVLAAGSVLKKSILEKGSLFAGIPAKQKRSIQKSTFSLDQQKKMFQEILQNFFGIHYRENSFFSFQEENIFISISKTQLSQATKELQKGDKGILFSFSEVPKDILSKRKDWVIFDFYKKHVYWQESKIAKRFRKHTKDSLIRFIEQE